MANASSVLTFCICFLYRHCLFLANIRAAALRNRGRTGCFLKFVAADCSHALSALIYTITDTQSNVTRYTARQLQNCGVPDWEIKHLQEQSRIWDEASQNPNQSNYHSMANPNQSIEDAINGRNAIVSDELNGAQAEWRGNHHLLALDAMAIAIHALMDMTSPAHMDSQGPIMWCSCLRESAQRSGMGRGWHFWPIALKIASKSRLTLRGANSPKYRTVCW